MSKINKILLGLVVALALALAGMMYWQGSRVGEKYSAVYLNTGDIYFGKLSRFPRMTLRDVWFLQKGGETQQGFGLSKFEKAFWGPEDRMMVNEENVIWVTELKEDSEVVRVIKNPQVMAPTQEGAMTQQQVTGEQEEVKNSQKSSE